jgi:hypothetical protein
MKAELNRQLQGGNFPVKVALGVGGAYWISYNNGLYNFNLASQYTELQQILLAEGQTANPVKVTRTIEETICSPCG